MPVNVKRKYVAKGFNFQRAPDAAVDRRIDPDGVELCYGLAGSGRFERSGRLVPGTDDRRHRLSDDLWSLLCCLYCWRLARARAPLHGDPDKIHYTVFPQKVILLTN